MQFISAPLSSRVIEWSFKSMTIIVMKTYRFWKSIRLMTERNASWFWFSRLAFGEDGGDWLGRFEDSSEETQSLKPWMWEKRIEFISSRRFCILIWFLNFLTSALSSFNPCLSKISSICFRLKGCIFYLITLSLSNKLLSSWRHRVLSSGSSIFSMISK